MLINVDTTYVSRLSISILPKKHYDIEIFKTMFSCLKNCNKKFLCIFVKMPTNVDFTYVSSLSILIFPKKH